MIASVRGTLLFLGLDYAVIEANGIGYRIFAPRPVLAQLGEVGAEARLYTHLHVREDILALYGFISSDQRYLFETLLGVSGIGPKVALSLLSSASSDELRRLIAVGDVAQLSKVPGIGKKTAERLVLELKGKIDLKSLPAGSVPSAAQMNANADLVDMLVSLGFSASEAASAVAALPANAPDEFEERLRLALRYFGGA
jgi:Holliday junction DNA helicase RuvA